MRKHIALLGILAILAALVTACGQRGPLYLPKDKPVPPPPPAVEDKK